MVWATGKVAEFFNCLNLDLRLVQLVPGSTQQLFNKIGVLELVCVGCRYYEALRLELLVADLSVILDATQSGKHCGWTCSLVGL